MLIGIVATSGAVTMGLARFITGPEQLDKRVTEIEKRLKEMEGFNVLNRQDIIRLQEQVIRLNRPWE